VAWVESIIYSVETRTSWVYYVGRAVVWAATKIIMRLHVSGTKNIPRSGPVLVVSNHLTLVDPPIIGVCIPRKMLFMAKKELFSPAFFGYFVRGFGAFPVERGNFSKAAYRQSCEVLEAGKMLMIFPEGGRSKTGKLQPGFYGAARLALYMSVPILPVAISGSEGLKRWTGIFRRPCITVNIGQPFTLSAGNGKPNKEELDRLTDDIMARIAGLLPEKYVGNYKRTQNG
jgi:1-acyl-sn-glycerol-3-phosphate acyltransferase